MKNFINKNPIAIPFAVCVFIAVVLGLANYEKQTPKENDSIYGDVQSPNYFKKTTNYIYPLSSVWMMGSSATDARFDQASTTELCLTGDSCITAWPAGGSGTTITQLGQIGDVSTSTIGAGYIIARDSNSKWTSTSSLFVKENGNVGIGNTNPAYKLEVDGTSDFGDTMTFLNGTRGSITWGVSTVNAGANFMIRGAANQYLALGANAQATHLIIDTSGLVGIGTTTPAVALDINGYAKVLQTSTTTACSELTKGSIFYNQENSLFWGCSSGGAWTQLGAGTVSGGSGTVTSVDMSVPTGLTIAGNPITTAGTLALTYTGGYSIPLTASTTEGSTAYTWGDHALSGYLTQATASTTFVDRADWTTHDNYPAACSNQFIRTIGDTNTCASVATTDFASANISQWTNDAGYVNFAYPFPSSATSTLIDFSSSIKLSTFTGLIAGNAGNLYQVASTSLFGFTPASNAINIATTYPLQGGGDLTDNRTLSLAFGTTTANTWADTQTFGAVAGISLNEIEDLTASKTFTMDSSNLTLNFTTPSDGLTINATGAFTDHLLHIHQSIGNPGSGTQLAHFMAEDADVIGLTIDMQAGSTSPALQILSGTSNLTGGLATMGNASTTLFTATTAWIPTLLGSIDASGALSFSIPANTDPTVNASGEIAINTASSSLRYFDGTAERSLFDIKEKTFTIASTSLVGNAGTTTIPLGFGSIHRETWTRIVCKTDTGTGIVDFGDGTNWMTAMALSSTASVSTPSSNNTFNNDEARQARIGTLASTPNYITCTISVRPTAD